MKKFLGMLAVLAVLSPLSTHAALINPGFETGNLTGWTVNSVSGANGLVVVDDSWLGVSPHEGGFMAVLAPGENGDPAAVGAGGTGSPSLSQTTFASDPVAISFWYNAFANFQGSTSSSDSFRLWVAGYLDGDIVFEQLLADINSTGPTTLGWTFFSTVLDLDTAKNITLNFRVRNDFNSSQKMTAFVDDVSVAPVSEPGTMLLLGSGLVGLTGWGRKKFQK